MRFFIAIIFICSLYLSHAQGFRVRHKLPGAITNTARAIFETSPGNYFGAGFAVDSVTGANRLYVMGLNSQGQILWKKKYGTNKLQYLDAAFCSRSYYKQGNYIYHAGCVVDTTNKQVGCLTKFDLNGDTVWQKIYRDPDPLEDVIPQMVTGSVNGGFLITGFFQNNSSTPYSKCMLIRVDANGNEVWRQKIAKVTPDTHDGKALVQDSASGKIVIVGYQYIGNSQSWDIYDNVVVTDSLGVKLSQRSYAGTGVQGILYDVIQTQDKKVVAVGYAIHGQNISGSNLINSYIVKFDLNVNSNTPVWKINNYDRTTTANLFSCLTELSNGEMLIAGTLDTLDMLDLPFNCVARITKINSSGLVTWNRYYDYKINAASQYNNQAIKSINLCSDGGWVTAIEVDNVPAPNPFFFVKYDSTGCDSSLAYCQYLLTVGLKENKFYNHANVNLSPNPFNDKITISLPNDFNFSNASVSVYNNLGQQVYALNSLEEKQELMLDHLPAGLYHVKIQSDDLFKTFKVLKD